MGSGLTLLVFFKTLLCHYIQIVNLFRFLLRENIKSHHSGCEGPKWHREFVGIQKIVEDAMDIIGQEAKGEGKSKTGNRRVGGCSVYPHTSSEGEKENG